MSTHRFTSVALALTLLITAVDVGVVATRTGTPRGVSTRHDTRSRHTTSTATGSFPPSTTATQLSSTPTSAAPIETPGSGPGLPTPTAVAVIPGTGTAPACAPAPDRETGISPSTVRIGQIVSDVSFLPAQLKPAHEGLVAYLNLLNASGGICGRKLALDYNNDNGAPATHEYPSMIHTDFAFVGNASLQGGGDYQQDAPFEPKYNDRGEYVPDIGGFSGNYGREQSPWSAGVIGSLSPSLTWSAGFKYLVGRAGASGHGPCRKAAVAYIVEPTGLSQDQAELGKVALAAPWGGNLGAANVKEYQDDVDDPEPVYEATVQSMVRDGVNCVFSWADLQDDINLAKAMADQGVWPPSRCTGRDCFSLLSMTFGSYDPKFIRDAGDAALGTYNFIPHLPLNEQANPVFKVYLDALRTVAGARPSTLSLIGFTSGVMFAQALQVCGAAPTRSCVMTVLRHLRDYTGAGLMSPVTPFRTTRVSCAGGCGHFSGRGVYDFKWAFPCFVDVQVQDRNGVRDFYRTNPADGFECDTLRIARGSAA